MAYFLGIDIGTTSTKALAVSEEGQNIALARASYPTLSPQPGFQEQDPEKLEEAVIHVLKQVAEETGKTPKAIGFSCAMHSLIAVDEAGRLLTKAILWSDSRSQKQARALRETELGRELYRRCGTPIHPMSPLCKLRWLREEEAELFKKAARFLSIKDYLLYRLCGEYAADYSLASATGLMDIGQLEWYGPALDYAGIGKERLPKLVSPTYAMELQSDALPRDWGGVLLVPGASDGCLANLGALALGPEELVLTIGTSGAVRTTRSSPRIDEELQLFNYRLDESLFVCGGPTNNGGITYEWLSELLGEERLSEADAAALPAGAQGVLFLPYLLGERAPIWDASATGAFLGLQRRHGPAHLYRATLEGVAFSLFHIAAGLASEAKTIVANGGFTQSALWVQIIADVFGLPVHIDEQEEATARGAAYMAMKGAGAIKDYAELEGQKGERRLFEPDMENHRVYQKVFEAFRAAYPALRPIWP